MLQAWGAKNQRDVWGQTHPQVATDSVHCSNCKRAVQAGRYAPHLEKCLGKVRAGRTSPPLTLTLPLATSCSMPAGPWRLLFKADLLLASVDAHTRASDAACAATVCTGVVLAPLRCETMLREGVVGLDDVPAPLPDG